jgi:hypothetical protein
MIIQIINVIIIFDLPETILILAHYCGLPSDVVVTFEQYTYFIPLLLLFVRLYS